MNHNALIAAMLIMVLIIIIVGVIRMFWWPDVEVVEETTLHEEENTTYVMGNLKRKWQGGQPYVIDPVDKDKVWVNTSDDMYEDGAGNFWKLV